MGVFDNSVGSNAANAHDIESGVEVRGRRQVRQVMLFLFVSVEYFVVESGRFRAW
jgi:hypothetical protein